MPSSAYRTFSENMGTVDRLLESYIELKELHNPEHKRGRVALDHITRSATIFLVSTFEVYIEDILLETVNINIRYAHNFINLPVDIQNMLRRATNRYPTEKWIQKYRRLVKEETDELNTPKIYKIQNLFEKYLAVPSTDINAIPNSSDINPIIIKRGKIVHTVKSVQYVKYEEVISDKESIFGFVTEVDNFLALNIKATYPNLRMPWNRI